MFTPSDREFNCNVVQRRNEERIGLTALEFGVLNYLRQREGRAMARAELLEQVWEQRADSGSNVVDVVVRSLRGKMRDHASMISTVRGVVTG